MFMLSLMQPSGLYELEKDSLEAISAQLLQMIHVHQHVQPEKAMVHVAVDTSLVSFQESYEHLVEFSSRD